MSRFENKVVLVTGGSSGIGLATAIAFANEGANVVITGRDQEALALAEKMIGSSARAVVSDAAKLDDIAALVEDIAGHEGTVDSVFVNAGSALPAPFGSVLEDNVDAMVDVHVKGPLFLLQRLTTLMPTGSAVVINGSVSATLGMPGMSAYAVGKAGLISLVRSLSAELLPQGIRLNAVSAGPVATPAVARADIPEAVKAAMLAQIPLGRPAAPEEIASVVLFLASPESSFIVGHNLIADGGMSALVA
ncbi:MAG: SDR family oxidoreductase [Actinomycetota bacterium]|nr:SDR family oxidoreductase [Actinomycetota bacterium]